MVKMVSCLLVALLMNGLSANHGLGDLTANKRAWGFTVYPTWFVKLIRDKYDELEKTLVCVNDTNSHRKKKDCLN